MEMAEGRVSRWDGINSDHFRVLVLVPYRTASASRSRTEDRVDAFPFTRLCTSAANPHSAIYLFSLLLRKHFQRSQNALNLLSCLSSEDPVAQDVKTC